MRPRELTLRGLVLGALITTIFTAANVYLGLKVGLTFASSIPAAVISMAILSTVKDSSILENNIVQTVASAAGTLSAIIFVLPGLVIVGWWTGFPFWQSFLHLRERRRARRAVHDSAPARAGDELGPALSRGRRGGGGPQGRIRDARRGEGRGRPGAGGVDRGRARGRSRRPGLAIVAATRLLAAEISGFFALGVWAPATRVATSGYNIAWSLALFGAGHLVGLSVGHGHARRAAHRAGPPPCRSSRTCSRRRRAPSSPTHTLRIWRTQVRFIGAGTIAISAIWTLAKLAKPVMGGLISTIAVVEEPTPPATSATAICRRPGSRRSRSSAWRSPGALAYSFAAASPLAPHATTLTLIAVPFVFVVGFLIAGVAGYMAGLIGASNSPISGIGILAIVSCASLLLLAVSPTPEMRPALVAFALFVTGIVFACATISNDNLQDLKTGQLVGASPRRQQIALIVGVVAGAAVIPSGAQPAREGLRLRRRRQHRRRRREPAAGAAGDAHLRARAGRDRRQPRLEDDRHRPRSSAPASSRSTPRSAR